MAMRKLLFFHALWCSPCKFFEREFVLPLSKRVGPEQIVKIDAQERPFEAEKYRITRLPTAVLVDDERFVDFVSLPDMERCVSYLNNGSDVS